MLRRGIQKRSRKSAAVVRSEDPKECPICYYEPSDKASPCSKFEAFPCTHKVCNVCFEKVEICPICRTGKDGTPGVEREKRERAEAAEARSQLPSERVIMYRSGGDGHPFSADNTSFMVWGLPPGMAGAMPELLSAGMDFNRARQGGRSLTIGQRQASTAAIIRFINGSIRIEDLLDRHR